MIEVTWMENKMTGDRIVNVIVPKKDLLEIKLDRFDRMVVESPEETPADVLQTLEILVRRQQEQLKEKKNERSRL